MTREAEERIRELEAELGRLQRRLEVKEREVVEIYRSRAWRAVTALRSLLQRLRIRLPRRRVTTERSDEIAPAQPGKYDVVCLAIHDWDFRFQRAQQLMTRFAAAGHRVFFVRPQFGTAPWVAARKAENVYEITIRGDKLELPTNDAVIIVQQPSWWPLIRNAPWPIVYDCMDLHSGFTTSNAKHDDELLAHADLVTVSSSVLERHARRKSDRVLVVRNACDYEHFARTKPASNPRPAIGYYGAIAEWFDFELVEALARKRTDWDFLLIGSMYGADVSRLADLPNVTLPGEQAYESLPDWLSRIDACIIPFKRTRLTEATNPVKVYEMLAAGRPVVSVPIPEVAPLAPLVRLASTAEEFEQQIIAALEDHDSETRKAFAREHTWEKRFELLSGAILQTRARQR